MPKTPRTDDLLQSHPGGPYDYKLPPARIEEKDLQGSIPLTSVTVDNLIPGSNGQFIRTTGAAAVWALIDAADVTSGILLRARLPSQVAYEDEANTFTSDQTVSNASVVISGGKLLIDGADQSLLSGQIGIVENVGNLHLGARGSVQLLMDDDGSGAGSVQISKGVMGSSTLLAQFDINGALILGSDPGGTERLRVNGRLTANTGLFGVTSQTDTRQVGLFAGEANTDAWLGLRPNGTAVNAELHFYVTDFTSANIKGRVRYETDNNRMEFWTGGGERLAISASGSLIFATAASRILPGATSFSLRNNADSADNLLITDAGLITTRDKLTVRGAAGVALLSVQDNVTGGTLTFGSDGVGQTHGVWGSSGSVDGESGQLRIKGNNAVPVHIFANGASRFSVTQSLVNSAVDFSVDVLGTFDHTGTRFSTGVGPIADDIMSWHSGAGKWRPRFLQTAFTSGAAVSQNNTDGTFSTFFNSNPALAGVPAAPGAAPVVTPLYKAMLIDMSAYVLGGTQVYVLDYSINGGAYTSGRIVSTSPKIIHSSLDPTKTYAYKFLIRGGSDSTYSAASVAANPSTSTEVNAFGLIVASQIATAFLSSINANIGSITAGQLISGDGKSILQLDSSFSVPAAVIQGVFFASANPVPGTVTGMYLDFSATGVNPLFHHSKFDLLADGSAILKGVVRDANSKFVIDVGQTTARLITIIDEQASPITRVKLGEINTGTADWGLQVFDGSGNPIVDMQASNLLIQDSSGKYKEDFTNAVLTVTDTQTTPKTRVKVGKVVTSGAELVANGNAETGSPGSDAPSWTQLGGNHLLIANDFAHGGSQSLKLDNTVGNDSFAYQNFALTGGRIYRLSAWIKTSALPSADAGFGAVLNAATIISGITGFTMISKTTIGTDPNPGAPDIGIEADGATHGFTYVESVFVPKTDGTIRVYCQLGYNGNQSGLAWFDDVSLVALADYGAQIFDVLGNTIADFTGAKRILAVPVQPSSDSGASITLDLSTGLTQQIRLTNNAATIRLRNPTNGGRYRLWLQQDVTGSRLFPTIVDDISGAAIVMYTNDTKPTLTTTPGALDLFEFEYRALPTARYTCMPLQANVLLPTPFSKDTSDANFVVTTPFGSGATTHNVTMPSTVVAGDLLVMGWENSGNTSPTTPSGWTLKESLDSGNHRMRVWVKVADGSEGGTTVNVTTSAAATAVAAVARFNLWFGSLAGVVTAQAAGTSTTPDPPSNTPGWEDRTQWVAIQMNAGGENGGGAVPSGYTLMGGDSTTGSGISMARRAKYALTENPSTFTLIGSTTWLAVTLAIRPPA